MLILPRVGGAVAESNYKFFVQFIFYTFVYTAFIVIVVACTLSDRTKNHVCLAHFARPPN